MARYRGTVLVDTNVILECWRIGAWRALANGYTVETVEDCIVETQTGYQRRAPAQQIDEKELCKLLVSVHAVTDKERAMAMLRDPLFSSLDVGERSLWAHALSRTETWVLCGPDKASLRFGIRCGFRDRLVALERLLKDAGYKPKGLRTAYTSGWLDNTLGQLVLMEGRCASQHLGLVGQRDESAALGHQPGTTSADRTALSAAGAIFRWQDGRDRPGSG
jgi:hypothetical protein